MGTNFGGVSTKEAARGFQSIQKVTLGGYPLSLLEKEPNVFAKGLFSIRQSFRWWKVVFFQEGHRLHWNELLSENGYSYSPWFIMRIIKQSFPSLEGQSKKEYDKLINQEYCEFCRLINK